MRSDFTNVPASANQPFTQFPTDFTQLPTVSFVVPNIQNDMHDGTIAQGDQWLQTHIDAYAQWAKTHNSLLIVTWDENEGGSGNQVPTIVVGSGIKPAQLGQSVNHYSVLRKLEDIYGLARLGGAANANSLF